MSGKAVNAAELQKALCRLWLKQLEQEYQSTNDDGNEGGPRGENPPLASANTESLEGGNGSEADAVEGEEGKVAGQEPESKTDPSTSNDHFSTMANGPTTGFVGLDQAVEDYVLCISFNDKGTRMVTGSADHRVQIYDKNGDDEWNITDVWRAHDAAILDVKWNGSAMGQVFGSVGDDLYVKIWEENPSQARNSGRRFACVFSQWSGYGVVYSSLDFLQIRHESYMALVTRDGVLSLMEPVDSEQFDDWKELDQIIVCGERIARGLETQFRVAFQKAQRPNLAAVEAGLDSKALTLAVTAMDKVYVYRIQKTGHAGDGQYRFQAPVAELTGSDCLFRDVVWSRSVFLSYDWIATAAADGYVRIYELSTPLETRSHTPDTSTMGEPASRAPNRPSSGIGAGLAGPAIAPSFTSIRHEWKLLAKLKHEGVWRVDWMGFVHGVISTGDDGMLRMWMKDAATEEWLERAEVGVDDME